MRVRHANRGHVRQGGCAMCKPERVREDHPGRAIERELEDDDEFTWLDHLAEIHEGRGER